jgi:hypothetical protein
MCHALRWDINPDPDLVETFVVGSCIHKDSEDAWSQTAMSLNVNSMTVSCHVDMAWCSASYLNFPIQSQMTVEDTLSGKETV